MDPRPRGPAAVSAPFGKILVANRGEIACRVIRTCREMGIATVAVASEADLAAPHARLADRTVHLGPPPPEASYLRQDLIVAAALATGAEAVHPGYGFLAENAAFARACAEAGLVFIGPPPDVIASMGEKTAARRLMEAAGVPVVPGATLPPPGPGGSLDAAAVRAAADAVGYPLLVKAAFGGGGKGMRLVEAGQDPVAAAEAAVREATGAFGDGTVYLERCLLRPRHVEFQIFADRHGRVVHLGERECSIQRRHQKIVEETPCPALDDGLRRRMGEAAVAAARAAGYVGAGTVEFLLAPGGEFYFLEMNTRLQVEHPVTEWVTGLDLVRAQILVAAGEPLPWSDADLVPRGHALECRLYAEDPAHGFLPSLGRLLRYREPSGPGVRVDAGVAEGDEITRHYDPMIAKLSVHAEDRAAAIARLRAALRDYVVLGIATNAAYLDAVLAHPAFAAGETHTGFLQQHLSGEAAAGDAADETAALVAAALNEAVRGTAADAARRDAPAAPAAPAIGRFRLKGLD
ncbi:MAG: acetyl-CoA carboxylase biotin carboxylase subunit [bacterium]|nr:acetyl-CoA carboxylase biotin carboxylase subunit [bacterium]